MQLGGNLTADPKVKYLPSQTAAVEFSVAVNRKYRTQAGEDREEVTFVDCTAFAKTGELIAQYFVKGRPIFVEGRLRQDVWDAKDGSGKRSKLSVIVDEFQFIGGNRTSEDEPGMDQTQDRPRPQQQRQRGPAPSQRPPAEQPFGDEKEFADADVPFAWSGRRQQSV